MKKGGSKRGSKRKGGYSSATTYMLSKVGNENQQWNNVFDQSRNHSQSNAIVSLNGKQHAGKKRKTQKGGFWNNLATAIVPFSILGLQQSFKRKKGGKGKRTRKMH